MRRAIPACSKLLALPVALAFAVPPASAAVGADAPATIRNDIRTACPKLHEELEDSLHGAWLRSQQPGTVQVRMTLRGARIVDVTPLAGPQRYLQPVRNAVGALDCRSDAPGDQVFVFNVKFERD